MRTPTAAAQAVLEGDEVPLIVLVEMLLTQPLRLVSAYRNVTYGGNTYLATGHFGTVDSVEDAATEIKPIRFTLSGVSNDTLSIALNEPTRGKPVHMYLGVLDTSTHEVLDTMLIWPGLIDQMTIEYGKETSIISVTSQHRGVVFNRPKPLRYIDSDQKRLHPGDTSMRFAPEQAQHPDIWPAAGFFRQ